MLDPQTPVIIGVGQSGDRIESPEYHAWSAAELAVQAARIAVKDAGASVDLLAHIDAIGSTRTFEDSRPGPAPFGKSSCLPRSIAKGLGINPRYALWVKGGGNSPQDLLTEFSTRIARGEFKLVLISGAEAISTVRNATKSGVPLNFSDEPEGDVEDRGSGYSDFVDEALQRHGAALPPVAYGLAETARRARMGTSREDYTREMGKLFSPLARVAHHNPRAAWDVPPYPADDLTAVGEKNRWISTPYPLHLVARDQVNLGAAILLTNVETARKLGIPDSKFVFLHGHAKAIEKPFLERPDLGASPAAQKAAKVALHMAGVNVSDIAKFDFYSCFPIAVSNVAVDALGLSSDDTRLLTVTGGLPYFGGPGNNYSMHAIAEMVEVLRQHPGEYGFVGANGGYLSKYSVGVYSTTPCAWKDSVSRELQEELDGIAGVSVHDSFEGIGTIETYSVYHERGIPLYATAIGRDANGIRFIARANDEYLLDRFVKNDAIGCEIIVSKIEDASWFKLAV